ncbi:HIT domain-containing protein [bacterium]|nr:HIT domain-containing protein [bacterium]
MREAPADNVFGRILRGELPSFAVYNDEHTYAFLDIFPSAPGHTLVIPRSWASTVADARPQDLAACMHTLQRLIPAVMKATGAHGVNVVSNNGPAAGQTIDYLHFHIVPRFSDDRLALNVPGSAADADALAEMAAAIHRSLLEQS